MTHAVLEARDVIVRRPGFTVHLPRLSIAAGDVLVLLGPNGAGKSTMLQALALLEPVASGEILLEGKPVRGRPLAARRRLAVVLQEPLLINGRVRQNVELGLSMRGTKRAERADLAARWMQRTGIAHLAERHARRLSGGEQRRVSLARAFVMEPAVLFLDEPLSMLDSPTKQQLLHELPGWLHDSGATTVLVTHDREEALRLGTRVAVVFDGEIRQEGTVGEVFDHPRDDDVAGFLGVKNRLVGEVAGYRDGVASVRIGTVVLEARSDVRAGAVVAAIIQDRVLLLPEEAPATGGGCSVLRCVIGRVDAFSSPATVHLDAGFPLVVHVTRAAVEALNLTPGQHCLAAIPASAVHLMPLESTDAVATVGGVETAQLL